MSLTAKNAFSVLLSTSQVDQLPKKVVAHNKEYLYNDLIDLFEKNDWKWCDCGNTLGASFLKQLRDVLWYIDGHRSVFENRSITILSTFKSFTGYNTPEISKHRKRAVGNMSYDVLVSHVAFLKESLLTSWLQQKRWTEL